MPAARCCLQWLLFKALNTGNGTGRTTNDRLQDVLPANEREALLAARHRPNAALQVMSQLILAARLRETQACLLAKPLRTILGTESWALCSSCCDSILATCSDGLSFAPECKDQAVRRRDSRVLRSCHGWMRTCPSLRTRWARASAS